MKAAIAVEKNLKLLLRSRETAYTIVAGPILIILLVSFAFLGSDDEYAIRVGVNAPQGSAMGERTVQALNDGGYRVSVYPDEASCAESVRSGSSHACLSFAQGNGTVPVRFHVDESRLNLVYRIIDDLSGVLEGQADAIRRQIAASAALRMESAAQLLDEAVNSTGDAAVAVDGATAALSEVTFALPDLPNGTGNVTDLRELRGYQQGLAANVRVVAQDADDAIDDSIALIRDLVNECDDCPDSIRIEAEELEDALRETQRRIHLMNEESTADQLFSANLLLEYAIEDLERIGAEFGNATLAGAAIGSGVREAEAKLSSSARDLRLAVARIAYARDVLRGDRIDVGALAAPVETTVVSVARTDDRLSFAYPYLLVLVIMFIGMLLASTLIVTDKTSRAAFRTFTTPVSDAYGTAMAFVTGVLILSGETLVIVVLSVPFVAQPLLNDAGSTLLILAIAILLFTAIGMIIGYLSRSQEAAMIACLSVGSVLLFVSNIIIPVEGLAAVSRALAAANPYIALSELLKRSMLYGVSTGQVIGELLWVLAFLAVLLGAAAWIQGSLKRRYFRQDAGLLIAQRVQAPLRLGDTLAHDAAELMGALDRMTRDDFERIVTSDDNPISRWALAELRQPRLARGLRTRSKERMILWLDRWLKKHGKHLQR